MGKEVNMEPYWSNKDILLAGRQALANREPSKKLLAYLKKYRQDLLSTGTPDGLPNFATQQDMLIALMRQKYTDGHGYHQTIGGRVTGLPKFWELMLSMDFVSHDIELTSNIGYDDKESFPGLRSAVEAPFAEFTIISDDLKREVALDVAPATISPVSIPKPEPQLSRITTRSYDAISGTLFFGKHEIQIIRQKKRQGSAVGETIQGGAMRKLFKDVNTLHNGVPLHVIISGRKENFDGIKRKRATNHLDEINRKVQEETGVSKLIIYDRVKYYVGKSYL